MEGPKSGAAAIVRALSDLEGGLDSVEARAAELRRGISSAAEAEAERLGARVREDASREAASIVEGARREAEAEAGRISAEADSRLEEMRARAESGRAAAVKLAVSRVLEG